MKNTPNYKQGLFNRKTLTVKFGGPLSKPENIFTCSAIKVPDFKYKVRERESLGGGWYGGMEENEYTENNLYVIIRDGVCIGTMRPYWQDDIKSSLVPIESKYTRPEAIRFLKNQNIMFNNEQNVKASVATEAASNSKVD